MRHSLSLVLLLSATVLAQQPSLAPAEALFDAARTSDRARIASLLDAGTSVNTASKYGVSALGFAAERGHLDIALYLLEHKSPGAASVLNAAIRQRNTGGVKAALATGQVDATALATANTIAKQAGDTAVIAMVKTAADATPAVVPVPITIAVTLLRASRSPPMDGRRFDCSRSRSAASSQTRRQSCLWPLRDAAA